MSVVHIYLEIISSTVNLIVGCQTAIIFGEKVINKKSKTRIMHSTGFLASISAIVYSIVRLIYWFEGPAQISCNNLLLIGGTLITSSISLSLLHLFMRADMINRKNNKQWPKYRVMSIIFMIFNIISCVIYFVTRHITQLPNGWCMYKRNINALIIRYISQAMNHIVQTSFFVYPLISHIYHMRKQKKLNSSVDTDIYINLTQKAFIGMMISALYTICLAITVCFYNRNALLRSIFIPLSIFDMALTLACVCYASTSIKQQPTHRLPLSQRRSSYTPSLENDTIV
jgi:hypothetical protein